MNELEEKNANEPNGDQEINGEEDLFEDVEVEAVHQALIFTPKCFGA